MLGSKMTVGCNKGRVTHGFLIKGTTACVVRSEVIHGAIELRRNKSDGLDRFKKQTNKQITDTKLINFCSLGI